MNKSIKESKKDEKDEERKNNRTNRRKTERKKKKGKKNKKISVHQTQNWLQNDGKQTSKPEGDNKRNKGLNENDGSLI